MDASAFDRLARTLVRAASRRAALGALLASAGGVLGLGPWSPVAAQGCLATHTECHMDAECCSGRCKRKRSGKKLCKPAENQGVCTIEEDICGNESSIGCGTSSSCLCYVTTSGRSFCGANSAVPPINCDCTSNKECERRVGKGAKCVQTTASTGSGGTCGCPIGTTTGCMAPCPELITPT